MFVTDQKNNMQLSAKNKSDNEKQVRDFFLA